MTRTANFINFLIYERSNGEGISIVTFNAYERLTIAYCYYSFSKKNARGFLQLTAPQP